MILKTGYQNGNPYTIFKNGDSIMCSCVRCFNGGVCYERQKFLDQEEHRKLYTSFCTGRIDFEQITKDAWKAYDLTKG